MSSCVEKIQITQSPFPLETVSIEEVKNVVFLFGISGCYTLEIGKYKELLFSLSLLITLC